MNTLCAGRRRLRPGGGRSVGSITGVSLALTIWLLAPSTLAAPEGTQTRCLAAYEDGQRARKNGALLKAAKALAFCGGPSCPAALHADCLRWLDEVELATPTSVFRVRSTAGEALSGVHVSVNGQPNGKLEGRAIAVDPGQHSLLFELPGYHPRERRITFIEGEKLVAHEIELKPIVNGLPDGAETEPEAHRELDSPGPSRRKNLVPVWIGTGVGVLGISGFAYFGLKARADDRALAECYPNCSTARVDAVEQGYLNGHISLAVGAVGLVGAAAWLFFGPDETGSATSATHLEVFVGQTKFVRGRF